MEPLLVGCRVSKLKLRLHVPVNTSLNQKHKCVQPGKPQLPRTCNDFFVLNKV